MTNKELQERLAQYPDDMPLKWLVHKSIFTGKAEIHEFSDECFTVRSETVYVDDEAPEEEWDAEDGKIELGDGQRFLLFNPIIQ